MADDDFTFTPPLVVPEFLPTRTETGLSLRLPPGTLPSSSNEYPVVEGMAVCDRCHEQHVTLRGKPSCNRHNAEGHPCRSHPMHGTTICGKHGGTAGQVQRAARQRLAEDEARKTLAEVDVVPIGNPIDELAQLAAEMLALKDHWADEVSQLESMRFTNDKGGEEIRSEVELYERGLDRVEKILTTLVRIDFESQRLQLEERRAHQVTLFMHAVLSRVGIRIDDPSVIAAIQTCAPILDGHDVIEVDEVA